MEVKVFNPYDELEYKKHLYNGIYTLQISIPKGVLLQQHKHKYSHTSILSSGKVIVSANGVKSTYEGPKILELDAGVNHSVYAVTDAVWNCIHKTDETDIDKIDDSLTS